MNIPPGDRSARILANVEHPPPPLFHGCKGVADVWDSEEIVLIVTSKFQGVEIRQKLFGGQGVSLDTQGWSLKKQEKRDGGDSELEREQVRLNRSDSNQNTSHSGSQNVALSWRLHPISKFQETLGTSGSVTTEAVKSIASKVKAIKRWFQLLIELVVMAQATWLLSSWPQWLPRKIIGA